MPGIADDLIGDVRLQGRMAQRMDDAEMCVCRALSKSLCTVCAAWTPAFAGVTIPKKRLVIPAEAGIHTSCMFQRLTLTGPWCVFAGT